MDSFDDRVQAQSHGDCATPSGQGCEREPSEHVRELFVSSEGGSADYALHFEGLRQIIMDRGALGFVSGSVCSSSSHNRFLALR